MQALILAAGFGTRLYPITQNIPKALIEINGRFMIDYVVDKLKEINVDKLFILSNNKFYVNFLEWSKKCNSGIDIKVLNNGVNYDSERRGAVLDFKFSIDFLNNEDVLLLASDNLFDFSLKPLVDLSFEKKSSSVILRRTKDFDLIKRCSCVVLDDDDKLVFFEEKPIFPKSNIFSIACYFLRKEDVDKINNHVFESNDNFGEIISFLYKESFVYGKIFDGFWADIGDKEELKRVRNFLK